MIADLLRAVPAAVAAAVLPGYFWACVLTPVAGLGERLAYSTALSMASVPVVAVALARVAGSGVTLWVAVVSAAIVFVSGALARIVKGNAPGSAAPVLPAPGPARNPLALGLIAVAVAIALAGMLGRHLSLSLLLLILACLVAAGVLVAWPKGGVENPLPATAQRSPASGAPAAPVGVPAARTTTDGAPARRTTTDGALARAGRPAGASPPWLRKASLTVVLALTAYRAYAPVVRHDWPYLRGGDQFSHAVMAEQMLAHGSYGTYLIYPPGFSALTAVICRFAALTPLELFPVLAPALLVLTALGAYALAARLWGWPYGIAAAGLSGLVLVGAEAGFAGGRYPDLASAYFLVVMAVAALLALWQSPSARSGVLVAVIGASAVFYHSVATLYAAALLALAGIAGLVCLLYFRRGRDVRVLVLALTVAAVLAAGYAAYVYDFAKVLGGRSAASKAVSIAVGSQPTLPPRHLLAELSPAIVWLGLLGIVVLAVGIRHLARPAQVLAALTVLLWFLFMYVGSRTSLDGFPQRFERDLGAPLSVTGALGLGLIVRSLLNYRVAARPVVAVTAMVASIVTAGTVVAQAARNLRNENRRGIEVLTPQVAAAGQWLARHNTGGNIISTPYMNPGISNRAVLAMGGYTGLQSYNPRRIAHPRSLPTAGRQPLLDSRAVLLRPATCQAAGILSRDDVHYVVLYRFGTGADLAGFRADPKRYQRVFVNPSVIIYRPVAGPCQGR